MCHFKKWQGIGLSSSKTNRQVQQDLALTRFFGNGQLVKSKKLNPPSGDDEDEYEEEYEGEDEGEDEDEDEDEDEGEGEDEDEDEDEGEDDDRSSDIDVDGDIEMRVQPEIPPLRSRTALYPIQAL